MEKTKGGNIINTGALTTISTDWVPITGFAPIPKSWNASKGGTYTNSYKGGEFYSNGSRGLGWNTIGDADHPYSIRLYYTRSSYTVTYVFSEPGKPDATSSPIPFEASFADTKPSGYVEGVTKHPDGFRVFTGWYTAEDLQTADTKVDFSNAKETEMPAKNLILYAGWKEPVVPVEFYRNIGGDNDLYMEFKVSLNGKVTKPADPTRDGFVFGGWFSDADCTVPFMFDLKITQETKVYAKWTERTEIPYTVKYLKQGTEESVAEAVTKTGTMNATYDETAVRVDQFIPVQREKSITLAATNNVLIFYYEEFISADYTVNYWNGKELLGSKTVKNCTNNHVTETFKNFPGYSPDYVQKGLDLSLNEEENVINFYYTPLPEMTYYVEYYRQNEGLNGYELVKKDEKKSYLGKTVSVNGNVKPDGISDFYEFYQGISTTKGVVRNSIVENARPLTLKVYYRAVELEYTVKWVTTDENGELKNLKDPETKKKTYLQEAEAVADAFGGYSYTNATVSGTTQLSDLTASTQKVKVDAKGITITFYYSLSYEYGYVVKHLEQGRETLLLSEESSNNPGMTLDQPFTVSPKASIDHDGQTYVPVSTEKESGKAGNPKTEIVFYYTAKLYNVTYDANGGSGSVPVDGNTYRAGATVTVAGKGSLSMTDAVFLGWSKTKHALIQTQAAEGAVVFEKGTLTMPNKDLTLYAVWAEDKNGKDEEDEPDGTEDYKEYSVTYVSKVNGEAFGTAPVDGRIFPQGHKYTIANKTPSMAEKELIGWQFNGWTANGTTYEEKADYVINDNVTFTANWSKKTYTVTFQPGKYAETDAGHGTIAGAGTDGKLVQGGYHYGDALYGESFTAAPEVSVPADAGYYFTGWSPAEPDDGKVVENLVFTAQYKAYGAEITVTAGSGNFTYNGAAQTVTDYEVKGVPKADFDKAVTVVLANNAQKEPGEYNGEANGVYFDAATLAKTVVDIEDENGESVKHKVTYARGSITIAKRATATAITFDKDVYYPGDDAVITIKVTDTDKTAWAEGVTRTAPMDDTSATLTVKVNGVDKAATKQADGSYQLKETMPGNIGLAVTANYAESAHFLASAHKDADAPFQAFIPYTVTYLFEKVGVDGKSTWVSDASLQGNSRTVSGQGRIGESVSLGNDDKAEPKGYDYDTIRSGAAGILPKEGALALTLYFNLEEYDVTFELVGGHGTLGTAADSKTKIVVEDQKFGTSVAVPKVNPDTGYYWTKVWDPAIAETATSVTVQAKDGPTDPNYYKTSVAQNGVITINPPAQSKTYNGVEQAYNTTVTDENQVVAEGASGVNGIVAAINAKYSLTNLGLGAAKGTDSSNAAYTGGEGKYTVTVGGKQYDVSVGNAALTINPRATTTTVASDKATYYPGETIVVSGTVKDAETAAPLADKTKTPTGNVTITIAQGTATLGTKTVAIGANGAFEWNGFAVPTTQEAGALTITAEYAGETNYKGSKASAAPAAEIIPLIPYRVTYMFEDLDGYFAESSTLAGALTNWTAADVYSGKDKAKVAISQGTAVPAGFVFDSKNAKNVLSGTLDAEKPNAVALAAYFVREQITVTFKAETGGKLDGNETPAALKESISKTVRYGTNLLALYPVPVPDAKYFFAGWSHVAEADELVTEAMEITASFAQKGTIEIAADSKTTIWNNANQTVGYKVLVDGEELGDEAAKTLIGKIADFKLTYTDGKGYSADNGASAVGAYTVTPSGTTGDISIGLEGDDEDAFPHAVSFANGSLKINKRPTVTELDAFAGPYYADETIAVSGTVADVNDATSFTPDGEVTITIIDPVDIKHFGKATLSTDGKYAYTLPDTLKQPGSYRVYAAYAGTESYEPSDTTGKMKSFVIRDLTPWTVNYVFQTVDGTGYEARTALVDGSWPTGGAGKIGAGMGVTVGSDWIAPTGFHFADTMASGTISATQDNELTIRLDRNVYTVQFLAGSGASLVNPAERAANVLYEQPIPALPAVNAPAHMLFNAWQAQSGTPVYSTGLPVTGNYTYLATYNPQVRLTVEFRLSGTNASLATSVVTWHNPGASFPYASSAAVSALGSVGSGYVYNRIESSASVYNSAFTAAEAGLADGLGRVVTVYYTAAATPTPDPSDEPTAPTPTPTPAATPTPTPAPTSTPVPATPTPTATATVTDNPIPLSTVEDNETPLAAPQRAWALLNLILMLLTVLGSVLMLIFYVGKKQKQELDEETGNDLTLDIKKHGFMRFMSLIPALGGIIAFILTEDMRLPMVFTDQWTLLMVAIAVIQGGVALLAKREKEEQEDPELQN